jgi:hypothetical protein
MLVYFQLQNAMADVARMMKMKMTMKMRTSSMEMGMNLGVSLILTVVLIHGAAVISIDWYHLPLPRIPLQSVPLATKLLRLPNQKLRMAPRLDMILQINPSLPGWLAMMAPGDVWDVQRWSVHSAKTKLQIRDMLEN